MVKKRLSGQPFEIPYSRNRIEEKEEKKVIKSITFSGLQQRKLLNTAKEGILIIDPITEKIVDANPSLIKILKYPLEKIIGKKLWEISLFRNKEKSDPDINELKRKLAESSKLIQKMNEDLMLANVKAKESDKLKTAFLANINHEIRTPMNAITGFSKLLLQPGLTKEKLADYVQIINTNSQQLLSVITDILDISKIETGQLNINSELVNINNLLKQLFETYKKIVEANKIQLYYSYYADNETFQIKTDEYRIKQILCNLLNNAIKFTRKGKIEFGYKTRRNFLEFYVKDTGIGIAPENHALIFQPFKQAETADTREYGGTGLGLSISKALVEKLGGTITVDSEPGRGSTFTFTIPYINKIKNPGISLKKTPGRKFNWDKKTILIAEDEIINFDYIEKLLSSTKIKIVHALNGREAVEHVKKHPDISLVLMDIRMPVMDGYEATQRIKHIRSKLPVIAQSAFAPDPQKVQGLQSGFDVYISKPVQQNTLVELIADYLI
ncbi:MAG: response regulator [Bacteroidales bacterium]|nr:response regulator [Bacteroidales bacterium]